LQRNTASRSSTSLVFISLVFIVLCSAPATRLTHSWTCPDYAPAASMDATGMAGLQAVWDACHRDLHPCSTWYHGASIHHTSARDTVIDARLRLYVHFRHRCRYHYPTLAAVRGISNPHDLTQPDVDTSQTVATLP
jgi:hypothetical protein